MKKLHKLTREEILFRLEHYKGWSLEDDKLVKEFRLASFDKAVRFFNYIALIAEDLNHHPDFFNSYNYCREALCTHDLGGISEIDFKFMEQLETYFNSNKDL
jgi:4a-hydroxytetrahydrobiopterin dehydratase